MNYDDYEINYDEILKAEMSKIFPIFRWGKISLIFSIFYLGLTTIIPMVLAFIGSTTLPGIYGSAVRYVMFLTLGLHIFWFWVVYRLYVGDHFGILWALFIVEVLLGIFWLHNYMSAAFDVWFVLSLYRTKKAIKTADEVYRDLKEAQRARETKKEREMLANYNGFDGKTEEPVVEDSEDVVVGKGGMRFCPKCSFALMPGETKCSRCDN